MQDLERAKRALIAADAAGDTEAATQLAQYIRQQTAIIPKPQQTKPDIGRTIFDQGLQGMTLGFSDEVIDPLGATIATAIKEPKALLTGEVTDPALAQELLTAEQQTEKRLQEQLQQRPLTSIASNIGGSLLTGGAGASTRSGAALGNILRSGGAGARALKGAASGAALSGLYGAGIAEEDKLKGAGQAAISGAVVGGALPVAGSAVKQLGGGILKGVKARTIEQLDDAYRAIKDASSKSYQAMRDTGARFTPKFSNNVTKEIADALTEGGSSKLNPRLHDKVIGLLNDMDEEFRLGGGDIESLDQWRQLWGEVAGNFNDKVNARKATLAIKKIDDLVSGINEKDLVNGTTEAVNALSTARKQYGAARRFESILDIIKKSDGDANYLKRELKKVRDNPKKSRGFNAKELEALDRAAKLDTTEGILKMLGKFGFDLGGSRIGSGVGAVVGSGAAGAGFGVPGAVLAPTVGTAARIGQKAIARGKVDDLLKIIEQSAGQLTQQQSSAIAKRALELPPQQANQVLNSLQFSLRSSPALATTGAQ